MRVLRTSEPIQHTLPHGMNEDEEQSVTSCEQNYQERSNTINLAGDLVSHNTQANLCKADGCVV